MKKFVRRKRKICKGSRVSWDPSGKLQKGDRNTVYIRCTVKKIHGRMVDLETSSMIGTVWKRTVPLKECV